MTRRNRIILWSAIGSATLTVILAAVVVISMHSRSSLMSANPSRDRYPVCGIDISAHNGEIDFEAVKADSIDFVIIKASEGADFKDDHFVDNMRRARVAHLPVGAYHFFRYDSPGRMQALNLLNSVAGRHLDLPLVIDVENWGNPSGIDTDVIVARLNEMIAYLRAHGYAVMLYTNKDGHARFFNARYADMPLWICSFTDPPGPERWILWQHTHRGSVAGIDGKVDMNTFNGSREQFAAWLSSTAR